MKHKKWTEDEIVHICKDVLGDLENNKFKVFLTRSGSIAIIFTHNAGGQLPLLGAYYSGEEWYPAKWMANGCFPSINESLTQTDLDLLMLPTKEFEPESA